MDKIARKLFEEGNCLVWQGCVNTDGYPKINRKGDANTKGHRYVYEQCKGEIPKGNVVRHTCDNKLCLNPDHLIVGTNLDNVNDRIARGRTYGHVAEDELVNVANLRKEGNTIKQISEMLGIKFKRVEYILNK